jgi:lipopolysaccharide assembly outer membrane protein LptD (OstA)
MVAIGNVKVKSDDNKLEAPKLFWNQKTKIIYTHTEVQITTPIEIINGIGFESNENLSNYRINKVKGVRNERPYNSRQLKNE